MSSAFRSRGFRLRRHEDIQSDGQARKRMNGFAEYLSIFSCREASSVVQSQLGKHGKLEPRPHSVLYKAHYRRKSGWFANPPRTGAHLPSGTQGIIVYTVLFLDWTKPTIKTEIKGPIPGELGRDQDQRQSQNTVTEEIF